MYSKQKCFCNACGIEMFEKLPHIIGKKWKVCSSNCLKEMNWRETLSIMGEEYREPKVQ